MQQTLIVGKCFTFMVFIIKKKYINWLFKNRYKVYRVFNEPEDNINNLDEFLTQNANNKIIIWKKTKTFSDVMVDRKEQNNFEKFLNTSSNNYSILIKNVQR